MTKPMATRENTKTTTIKRTIKSIAIRRNQNHDDQEEHEKHHD
jgi:hypothetical protein